ncbi:DNA primase [Sanguibacter sp. A247]|uniref:DNA primase n=1 Tax=unclassified Sanguibacter TaxID=2645534 RepID=UPI003FD7109B
MAGLIKREDVDAVRDRARIEEVVGSYVTLKPAGVGSQKGLCPFHDERTPSFHVRPQVGRWHCFGCGEGGDVISFVQKIDGLGFTEAVEYLAGRAGITLRYEEGGAQRRPEESGRRQRLVEANRTAAQFFAEQLFTPGAGPARDFLAQRSFDRTIAEQFGVGFAPEGWSTLLTHLRGRGFTEAELLAAGLVSQGNRGVYDRFRGRLIWPIRDVTGEVIGFGARRLLEEDQGPKYLNTPETVLYKKSNVLYGLDLAKREIARTKRVVVVEGYTDVMAAHLSGIGQAIATCGTAFGTDHVRVVRRLVGDTSSGAGVQLAGGGSTGGEIIFTFDGDAAGQKAALRAFNEDQRFYAQTFVAVEPHGMDPCDLRLARGPEAVRALIDSREPLFEFVVRSTLRAHNLSHAEGRIAALRASAPVVAGIRDRALRAEYARQLAGWLGMEADDVRRAVSSAERAQGQARHAAPDDVPQGAVVADAVPGGFTVPDRRDPVARLERQVLEAVLQHPGSTPDVFDDLGSDAFSVPAWRAVHEAIRAAGGVRSVGAVDPARWVATVVDESAGPVAGLVGELAVSPLPEDRESAVADYVRGVVHALVDMQVTRRIADQRSVLQRTDAEREPEAYQAAFAELLRLEQQRRLLRETTAG